MKTLTKEELRVRVAELCGWKRYRSAMQAKDNPAPDRWKLAGNIVREVPDYPNDLNAMHDAEKTLTREQGFHFNDHLSACFEWKAKDGADTWIWHATAEQRARAFCAVLEGVR